MLDAMRAHEQGVGSISDIDAGMMAGASHPMGPLTLADFVGLDTLVSISEVMVDAYGEERFAAPDILRKMVDAGDFGRKSGKGFYDYSGEKPVPSDQAVGARVAVDETSLDRIRNATFPSSRRGYDKHEVEKFLSRLADWLETGGGDESRSDAVKRELERVGERTGAILSQAEESAQQIRSEAEGEARATLAEAKATAEKLRGDADAYAAKTRSTIDREAAEQNDRIEREVEDALLAAEDKAARIVEEGVRRREDLESLIADLVGRRDEVLADVDELSARLEAAISEHRARDSDPYARPAELDPQAAEEEEELPEEASDVDYDEDDDGSISGTRTAKARTRRRSGTAESESEAGPGEPDEPAETEEHDVRSS